MLNRPAIRVCIWKKGVPVPNVELSTHVACGRDSVLFWQRRNTLSISGLVDDVMFAPDDQVYATERA